MKLLRLTATFGCLSGDTLTFGPGLTLIGAPNGGGKSTWCAFLRTMLYGLDTRQRDRKGVPADKNRYRPWNGAPMEGLLVCEHQGQVIELRRTSADGVPMGTFSARDQETGLPVPGLTGENAGEILTGVSREVFDRSVFLRQTGLAVSQSQELEKRIAALVSTGEEDVSWTEANDRLKTWLHRRRFHSSGRLPQLEQEAEELRQTLSQTDALRQQMAQVQARTDALRRQKAHWDSRLAQETTRFQTDSQRRYAEAAAQLDAAELQVQTLQARREELDQEDPDQLVQELHQVQRELASRRRLMTGFVTFIVLLTLCAAALVLIPRVLLPAFPGFPLQVPEIPLLFLAPPVGVLWLLVLLFTFIKAACDKRDRQEGQTLRGLLEAHQQEAASLDQALTQAQLHRDHAQKYFEAVRQPAGGPYLPPEAEACQASLRLAEQELAQLQGRLEALGDPVFLDAQLDQVQEDAAQLRADCDALEVAMETLRQAEDQLHARFSPQLSRLAQSYFARLTQGRFAQVFLDRALQVTVREEASLADRPLAQLSQGTTDQLYLALRLAVADLVLPAPRACPLILDDALLSFDDGRLAVALDLLGQLAQTRQILLFTCQHRELEQLGDLPGLTTVLLPGF